MATDTPPTRLASPPVDPERPTNQVIPAVLAVLLLAAVGYGIYTFVEYIRTAEVAANQELKFVFRRLEESVKPLGDLAAGSRLGYLLFILPPALCLATGLSMWRKMRANMVDTPPPGGYWEPGLSRGVLAVLFAVPSAVVAAIIDRSWLAGSGFVGWLHYLLTATAFLTTSLVLLLAYYALMESVNWWRAGRPVTWWWKTFFMLTLLATIYVLVAAGFVFTGKGVDPRIFWWSLLIIGLVAVKNYVGWMYRQDAHTVGWAWATFLGVLRGAAYLLIAAVFLLPALQTWDRTEAFSRVLVLLDLSGSMQGSDEITSDGKPGATRLDHVAALFTKDDGAFFKALQKQNPVYVYGFGGTHDPEAREFRKGDDAPRWARDQWSAWMRLDLKQWALDGLSDKGRGIVLEDKEFTEVKANPEQWATEWFAKNQGTVARLDKDDREKLQDKGKNLQQRLKTRFQILTGTNYGDALLNVLGQEEKNMLAGIIVIGDGQNTQGSASTFEEVQRKAQAAKAPIFTVLVGEERPKVEIRITDLQAPSKAPPSDVFLARVEVDGEGLDKQKVPVELDVFKAGEKIMTLRGEVEFKSAAGGTPHGVAEFKFDPESDDFIPMRHTEKKEGKEDNTKEFAPGEYKLSARIPKDKREMFPGKEHVSDVPVTVNIVKRALRVLLVAGGPTKDYQFTRRLFMNERAKGLAEVCVFLQVTDPKGPRAQDVPENQLLRTFPDTFRVEEDAKEKPEERYYNLARYDVIICFDPDWTKIDPPNLERLKKWVELQGGGLIILGGINMHKLTERALQKDLQPIIDLLPVVVDDDRRFSDLEKPTDKPFALKFPTNAPDADFMKLDDKSDYPLGGWYEFFYGKPKKEVEEGKDPVAKGFFRCYPSKSVKQTATVLATFPDKIVRDDGKVEDQPYIATMPYPEGKVVYLAGEMWRLRHARNGEQYHERFWTKLARYAGSGAMKTESHSRGVLVMGRQFTSGKRMEVEAKLRGANITEPLPQSAEPVILISRTDGDAEKPERRKLQPKREGTWDGWFFTRFDAPAPGKYQLELQVPGSTEVLRQEFYVKEFNPELDNTRPDRSRLVAVASPASELRLSDPAKKRQLDTLLAGVARPTEGVKEDEPRLFFDLNTATHIPEFLRERMESHSHKGKVEDLWSKGPAFGELPDGTPRTVALVLLVVVGLLSAEWLTRKLLKLA